MVFSFTGRGQSNLDAQIDRSCNDSTIQDFKNNKIYYFGGAVIKYDDIEIQADYIEFDFEKHTVFAKGMPDSTGRIVGKPVFTQAGQKYYSDEMSFNFDTKKGIIRKVFTEDNQNRIRPSNPRLSNRQASPPGLRYVPKFLAAIPHGQSRAVP